MPDIEKYIIDTQVEAIDFEGLIKETNCNDFQLLHIDTEGHDFEILKSIDLEIYKPEIILYEMKHLSLHDFKQSVLMLKNNGYFLHLSSGDCLAIHKSVYNFVKSI